MTTSGTTSTTSIEVADILDHAARRCGVMPSSLSTENIQLLKDNLYMLMSNLSNRGINLWKVVKVLQGLYLGQADYPLSNSILDILYGGALYRTPQRLSGSVSSSSGGTTGNLTDGDTTTICTQSAPGGNFVWDFGVGATANVFLVGLLPSGAQTLNLVFETSPDGVIYTTGLAVGSFAYSDGVWQWYEIDPAPATRFFRVRETSTGTISMREIFLSQVWTEVTMYRMNRDEFEALPNKKAPGLPMQFWFNRSLSPTMSVWQVPTNTFTLMYLFTHQYMQDVGGPSNTLDIPQRLYSAIVANLAYMSILDLPGAVMERFNILKAQAIETMSDWEAEERDNSSINFAPNIGAYTK